MSREKGDLGNEDLGIEFSEFLGGAYLYPLVVGPGRAGHLEKVLFETEKDTR